MAGHDPAAGDPAVAEGAAADGGAVGVLQARAARDDPGDGPRAAAGAGLSGSRPRPARAGALPGRVPQHVALGSADEGRVAERAGGGGAVGVGQALPVHGGQPAHVRRLVHAAHAARALRAGDEPEGERGRPPPRLHGARAGRDAAGGVEQVPDARSAGVPRVRQEVRPVRAR
jgi:hypothetical protein